MCCFSGNRYIFNRSCSPCKDAGAMCMLVFILILQLGSATMFFWPILLFFWNIHPIVAIVISIVFAILLFLEMAAYQATFWTKPGSVPKWWQERALLEMDDVRKNYGASSTHHLRAIKTVSSFSQQQNTQLKPLGRPESGKSNKHAINAKKPLLTYDYDMGGVYQSADEKRFFEEFNAYMQNLVKRVMRSMDSNEINYENITNEQQTNIPHNNQEQRNGKSQLNSDLYQPPSTLPSQSINNKTNNVENADKLSKEEQLELEQDLKRQERRKQRRQRRFDQRQAAHQAAYNDMLDLTFALSAVFLFGSHAYLITHNYTTLEDPTGSPQQRRRRDDRRVPTQSRYNINSALYDQDDNLDDDDMIDFDNDNGSHSNKHSLYHQGSRMKNAEFFLGRNKRSWWNPFVAPDIPFQGLYSPHYLKYDEDILISLERQIRARNTDLRNAARLAKIELDMENVDAEQCTANQKQKNEQNNLRESMHLTTTHISSINSSNNITSSQTISPLSSPSDSTLHGVKANGNNKVHSHDAKDDVHQKGSSLGVKSVSPINLL
ncbi:MAG: hypothetical protein EZS28_019237 [Streblomastix strix]|uniref:Uncharacterized protein n=1 Tax=Streblomastix strix TaxID=222440 RepID=A0A5J4VRG2_9EUKA|nr:MAG: hypothetical protein EZS28_019237 [Streblomastix strix]